MTSQSAPRTALVLAGTAAFLAGVAGLGLQSLLVASAGLALGYGGSVAIGLSAWLAAWAFGAWLARGRENSAPRYLFQVGIVACLLAPASVSAMLWAGSTAVAPAIAVSIALAALILPALAQGFFLPLLARSGLTVGLLFAFNFLGALAGAQGIADFAVGAAGRLSAAFVAGGAALLAGVLGALAVRRAAQPETRAPQPSGQGIPRTPKTRGAPDVHGELGAPAQSATRPTHPAVPERVDLATHEALTPARAALVVGLAVAWMSLVEWILVRLGVLWLGGMQDALNAVLCASLLALAIGAAVLPPLLSGRRHALSTLLLMCVATSLWPLVAALFLREAADSPLFVRATILCVPALFPFGAVVPLVHARVRAQGDGADRLARLLLHEVWGAGLGIPLVHFVVLPRFGSNGALAVGIVLGAAALAAGVHRARTRIVLAAAALLAATAAASLPTPARASAPLAHPAFTLRSLAEDRDFAVAVVDDGILGERTLMTDGFRAAGTGRDYLYMEALGHLPLLLHPAPRRVAVLALGTGTTVGAVALHAEVERIDVLEISQAVVAAAPYFVEKNHGALSEGLPGLCDAADGVARVVVELGDGRASLSRAEQTYDVITMEPLLPDSPFAVYLYTREFYDVARRALREGGLVCQWVPPHALEPATFDAVVQAFTSAFAWSGVWVFGTQVVLVGAAGEPRLDAARFPAPNEPLHTALARSGLATPSDVAARWCGSGLTSTETGRVLTDEDPWIAYRPRRRGAVLLLDLPLNLARLAEQEWPWPQSWSAVMTEAAAQREGQHALRAARCAHAFREAELRGARSAHSTAQNYEHALGAAQVLGLHDPDLTRLTDEVAFLAELRAGVAALGTGQDRAAAELARAALVSAAKRRPERADVHLYAAIALARLGNPAAEKALQLALELCPGLARTDAARIARQLGVPPALSARLDRAVDRP